MSQEEIQCCFKKGELIPRHYTDQLFSQLPPRGENFKFYFILFGSLCRIRMCQSIRSKNKATEASCSQAPPVRSQDCGRAYLGQKGKMSNQSFNDKRLWIVDLIQRLLCCAGIVCRGCTINATSSDALKETFGVWLQCIQVPCVEG